MAASANLKNSHLLEEELELLASVFCLDNESCDIKTIFPNHVISVTQRVNAEDKRLNSIDHDNLAAINKNESTLLCLSFELPPEYPLMCPSVSVHCNAQGFTRSLALKVSEYIKEEALALIGEPMLFQLCQSAKAQVSEIISSFDCSPTTSKNSSDCKKNCLTLIEIDHMRNKTGYMKILSKWADQLNMTLLVFHLLYKKRKQFLLSLWGLDEDIKGFLRNLKTHSVDVDSSGKPCKEKLVNVLCSSLSGMDFNFEGISGLIIEEIESEPQLKAMFKRYNLSQVYDEYVDC